MIETSQREKHPEPGWKNFLYPRVRLLVAAFPRLPYGEPTMPNHLKALIAKAEADNTPGKMLEAQRRFRQKFILQSDQPQEGIYWWLPFEPDWQLFPFLESFQSNSNHADIWEYYLGFLVTQNSSHEVRLAYAGLPRGRVAQTLDGKWTIYHGHDTPGGDDRLEEVARNFCLTCWTARFDEHEVMIRDHQRIVKEAMGHEKQLPIPPEPDLYDE